MILLFKICMTGGILALLAPMVGMMLDRWIPSRVVEITATLGWLMFLGPLLYWLWVLV